MTRPSDDPHAGFSDMQWFMFHQRNVVFYAAFSMTPFDRARLDAMVAEFVALTPQVTTGYVGAVPGALLDPAIVRAIASLEEVTDFAGFPEAWLGTGFEVFADPSLPLFRFRCANRRGGADAQGRAGFLVVRVSHALVEGFDSAELSRSHPIERQNAPQSAPARPSRLAQGLSVLAVPLHLLAATILPGPRMDRIFATCVWDRRRIAAIARSLGVRQRSLIYALILNGLFGAGTAGGKRHLSLLYSVLDHRPDLVRDGFIRMRTLQARFSNDPHFAAFARRIDRRFSEIERADSGFNQTLNTASVRLHRGLNRLLPFAYSPKVFNLIPFDVVIGLIPPHYLGGSLTRDLIEPVWCGTTTPGLTSCVIVPNRHLLTLGLYLTPEQAASLPAMDATLAGLAAGPVAPALT